MSEGAVESDICQEDLRNHERKPRASLRSGSAGGFGSETGHGRVQSDGNEGSCKHRVAAELHPKEARPGAGGHPDQQCGPLLLPLPGLDETLLSGDKNTVIAKNVKLVTYLCAQRFLTYVLSTTTIGRGRWRAGRAVPTPSPKVAVNAYKRILQRRLESCGRSGGRRDQVSTKSNLHIF